MKTVIAHDRIGRFAELDHTVLEEVRVIMEAPASDKAGEAAGARATRPLDWLCTKLQKAIRPGRTS